jgi:hypothetical protein
MGRPSNLSRESSVTDPVKPANKFPVPWYGFLAAGCVGAIVATSTQNYLMGTFTIIAVVGVMYMFMKNKA